MSLFKVLTEENLKLFTNAQDPNTGRLSPRVGDFIIKKLVFEKIGDTDVQVAHVEWKPIGSRYFLKDVTHKIALRSLYHIESKGPKDIDPQDLIGKMFSVDNIAVVHDLSQRSLVRVYWYLIHMQPEYITEQNAAIISLGETGSTLREAWADYEKNAAYDIGAALEAEATRLDNESLDLIECEAQNMYYFPVEDCDDELDLTGIDPDEPNPTTDPE